jgi:CDP-glucose 4,6-dehydratase
MENLANLEKLSSFYKDKRVFVTGHTGFKGGWLVACLHLLGAKVKGYSLPPEYVNGLYHILQPAKIGESILADIRDKERLQNEIEIFAPDYIFHLAAQPLVRRSYEMPAMTFEVNVTGTANLLEAVHKIDKKCTVVVITTDKVYENKEQDILYAEGDNLGGYDPYSASKACTELVVSSFRNSFFPVNKINYHHKGIASVRAGNVIGGGDWSKDRIIPDIVRALQLHEKIEVRNPNAIRPWQHVLEPIGGYLLLAGLINEEPAKFSKPYNFGPLPGDHLTVKEVTEVAIDRWGGGAWIDGSNPSSLHEAGILKLSIERAKQELHWQPKLDAGTAIKWTIDWYKVPLEEAGAYTFQQIKDYFAL